MLFRKQQYFILLSGKVWDHVYSRCIFSFSSTYYSYAYLMLPMTLIMTYPMS